MYKLYIIAPDTHVGASKGRGPGGHGNVEKTEDAVTAHLGLQELGSGEQDYQELFFQ